MLQLFLDVFRSLVNSVLIFLTWRTQMVIMNALKINVRVGTNKFVALDVDPKWTIGQVKEILGPKVELQPHEIRVIFAGRELDNSIKVEECDLGQQSIIHIVKGTKSSLTATSPSNQTSISTVLQQKLTEDDLRINSCSEEMKRIYFFIYCSSPCSKVCHGKLRVRCNRCKLRTLTVNQDPCCWDDVLLPNRIPGNCQADGCDGSFADFFFKCVNHSSADDEPCVPLYLIRPNLKEIPCLACMEISNPVLVFTCKAGHNMCLGCFQAYCISRLNERRFIQDRDFGYTLPCPIGCDGSLIKETHHFKLLGVEQYLRYQHFGAEECLLQVGGVLCPRPGCGAGILPDKDCRRITCIQLGGQGCGFVFCRYCLQGYHIGDCIEEETTQNSSSHAHGDQFHTERVRWDEASKITIRGITKPCPKCRTPTEHDGGCMHMVCGRPQCGFHWCWICQEEWTRLCMGNHWFG